MKNKIGKEIPDQVGSYKQLNPFAGSAAQNIIQNNNKLKDFDEVLDEINIQDGMTITFHHHFREGDILLETVLDKLAARGVKDLVLAPSSLTNAHSEAVIKHVKNGLIKKIHTSGLRGKLGEQISKGLMDEPVIIRSHGGRAGAIETGRLKIDAAFIAAPTADSAGNMSGSEGASACGALGYAAVDARHADQVIAFTDNLVEFPVSSISIPQRLVDYVVKVDQIGDPSKIAAGALRKTADTPPKNMLIAEKVTEIIAGSRYFKNNFSLQTGSGTISLATIDLLKNVMDQKDIKGSFLQGGIAAGHVKLLEEGYFKTIFDTQTFDRVAVESMAKNKNHIEMDADDYANPFNKAPRVNNLDFVILSALEVDLDFNVNVITGSDGVFRGASGGHSDTAFGSEITIIVAPSIRGRIPTIKESVTTVITPGSDVDILVTERGVCVNPARSDIRDDIENNTSLELIEISELKAKVEKLAGEPREIKFKDNIVGLIEYRDGTIIDVVREVESRAF